MEEKYSSWEHIAFHFCWFAYLLSVVVVIVITVLLDELFQSSGIYYIIKYFSN